MKALAKCLLNAMSALPMLSLILSLVMLPLFSFGEMHVCSYSEGPQKSCGSQHASVLLGKGQCGKTGTLQLRGGSWNPVKWFEDAVENVVKQDVGEMLNDENGDKQGNGTPDADRTGNVMTISPKEIIFKKGKTLHIRMDID